MQPPPLNEWVKLNMDSAHKEWAGCGDLIRGSEG
jgi:hypothetical protein